MPGPRKAFQTELGATLSLAIPMMVGQFGQMLMGITDTLVLGRVGVVPLAAIGFSNTLLGTLYVGGIGVLAAVGIFAAQAHGAKLESAKVEVFRSSFWLSLFVGIATAAIVIVLLPVLNIFGEPVPVEIAAKPYLAIVGLSLIPALGSMSAKTYCEALGKPVIPTVILYAGVILNVALNLPLVFGWFGLPALGLTGSAIATLCARIFVLLGIIGYALFLTRLQWQALTVKGVSWEKVGSLFRTGLPLFNGSGDTVLFVASRNHDRKHAYGLLGLRPGLLHDALPTPLFSSQSGLRSAWVAISSRMPQSGDSMRQPKSRSASLESIAIQGIS
jgi:Na+-driven multidrug efflux pump